MLSFLDMMIASKTTVILVLLPILLLQFLLVAHCNVKLAYCKFNGVSTYIFWNLFILFIFFIGPLVFLIMYKNFEKISIDKSNNSKTLVSQNPEIADNLDDSKEEADNLDDSKEETDNLDDSKEETDNKNEDRE